MFFVRKNSEVTYNLKTLFIPWINQENEKKTYQLIDSKFRKTYFWKTLVISVALILLDP